jgi:hypothetical protein
MQVNYYAKYLKYKQKYLDLKEEMMGSGGPCDKKKTITETGFPEKGCTAIPFPVPGEQHPGYFKKYSFECEFEVDLPESSYLDSGDTAAIWKSKDGKHIFKLFNLPESQLKDAAVLAASLSKTAQDAHNSWKIVSAHVKKVGRQDLKIVDSSLIDTKLLCKKTGKSFPIKVLTNEFVPGSASSSKEASDVQKSMSGVSADLNSGNIIKNGSVFTIVDW